MRWRFLARRLAMLVASLLVASFAIFGALYLAPGNPVAALSGGRSLPASSLKVLEARYHLNQPFIAQYWYWLDDALHGNLGISITLRENVSGLKPGLLDTSALVASAISAAIPSFVAAIVLIALFAVRLRWFPALGNGTDFVSNLRHFTLPAVALALSSLAIVARVTRAAIREEADREHVQTAVSRGIPRRQLVRRHILRNAAIPITTISGITIASLIAVAAVVETAFSLNGLGAYLVTSAQGSRAV